MFSGAKGSPFSLNLPSGAQGHDKKLTPEEKYQQALVTANVFLDGSRARLTKSMDAFNGVANSSYWFYGYAGGSMVATMAACLSLGNRIPFFRAYSGWIALAGGYLGGKAILGTHSAYLLRDVVKQIDHEIEEARRMDAQTQGLVPDYMQEAERLKHVKYELMPTLPEAIEERAAKAAMTIDDRVDSLVDAYLARKKALEENK